MFSTPAIDIDFSQTIQQYQPGWLTLIMRAASTIVTPEFICVAGLLTVVYLHIKKHDEQTIAKLFFISTGYLLIPVLKDLVARPRPTSELVNILTSASDYSFPSGHALGSVLLGGMVAVLIGRLAHHHQKILISIVGFIILLVGYSRIYLGVHWLTDVLAGYILGLLWVIVVLQIRWTQKLPRGNKRINN